jgi:hypothetical protein
MLAGHEAVKATIESINQMQADGIIGNYAIGGAVGATFYLEPAATLDVDIFVTPPTAPGGLLLSHGPIYDYLKARGGTVEDEPMVIGGWPVQFLPASDELELEGLAEAVPTTIRGCRDERDDCRTLGRHRATHWTSQGPQPHFAVYRARRGLCARCSQEGC